MVLVLKRVVGVVLSVREKFWQALALCSICTRPCFWQPSCQRASMLLAARLSNSYALDCA